MVVCRNPAYCYIMAKKKIKFTRPELKRQRDDLKRFQRYLPMLKLKQQMLQMTLRTISKKRDEAEQAKMKAIAVFEKYGVILKDIAGVNVKSLAECKEILTHESNIAGVNVPVYEDVVFEKAAYSLFTTPAWVDDTIEDLREVNRCNARMEILQRQFDLLQKELSKIIQRVNLFEKVKIPEAKENIRKIKIQLSDEMAAAVGRAKIAKGKLTEKELANA